MPFFGCFSPELVEQALEAVAVFREVDGVGAVPRIGAPACVERLASFRGVCPPNCTMAPGTFPSLRSVR